MCCGSFWTALQVLWGTVYVLGGTAQLLSGIFFALSVPELPVTSNLWAGSINIALGLTGSILVCFKPLSPKRQEAILYMAVVILCTNIISVILNECGLYFFNMKLLLNENPNSVLVYYGCFATRIAGALIILIAFLDTQFAFCSMQCKPRSDVPKKLHGSHEHVSDIEYIIPRQKSISKSNSIYDAYAQSWVFEAENAPNSNLNSPSAKPPPPLHHVSNGATPKKLSTTHLENGDLTKLSPRHLIDNPVVHIDEASDDSNSISNRSDRKIGHMKSFSRAASPAALSAASSQVSLNLSSHGGSGAPPQIYECLEKLTEPQIYRSRLNTAVSNKDEDFSEYQAPQAIMMRRVESISPRSEKVQYASLLKELQSAITSKNPQQNVISPTQSNSSKGSSKQDSSRSENVKTSDTEFSKELEAALKIIQDLESPNTLDTPSENKSSEGRDRPLAVWKNSNVSDSEKTLNALGSLGEIPSPVVEVTTFKPNTIPNGKPTPHLTPNHIKTSKNSIIIHYPDSQSTSGYSSPTHPPSVGGTTPQNWSTTSSINGNDNIAKPVAYNIHNAKSTTVISLFAPEKSPQKQGLIGGKNVTLVEITGNNEPATIHNSTTLTQGLRTPHKQHEEDDDIATTKFGTFDNLKKVHRMPSTATPAVWKSLLRKTKKNSLPKLCPELEGAIIKSESLAYLSELELLARHQRNAEIQREIEERVIQQLGTPRTESNC